MGLNPHTSRPVSGPLASSRRSSVPFWNLQLRLLPFKTPFLFLLGGRHCETFVDVCPQKPCLNGGTCAVASNMPDGFICRCPPVSALLSFPWRAVEILPETASSLICDSVFGGPEGKAQEVLGCALGTGLVSLAARSSAGGRPSCCPNRGRAGWKCSASIS